MIKQSSLKISQDRSLKPHCLLQSDSSLYYTHCFNLHGRKVPREEILPVKRLKIVLGWSDFNTNADGMYIEQDRLEDSSLYMHVKFLNLFAAYGRLSCNRRDATTVDCAHMRSTSTPLGTSRKLAELDEEIAKLAKRLEVEEYAITAASRMESDAAKTTLSALSPLDRMPQG